MIIFFSASVYCLSISEIYERIFMKLSGGVGRCRRKNRLDFGADRDSFIDMDHFKDSSALRDRAYRDRCCDLANVYELMYATEPAEAIGRVSGNSSILRLLVKVALFIHFL